MTRSFTPAATDTVGTSLAIGNLCTASNSSGGTVLGSGGFPIFSVSVVSISGNSPLWIGGNTPGNYPTSGRGIILYAGAALDLRVHRVDDVRVFAEVSGQQASYVAVRQ